MILVDFSGIFYQTVFSTCSALKPKENNGKYNSEEIYPFIEKYLLRNLFNLYNDFQRFGEMVLCLDGRRKDNFRTKIYPKYKASRSRENSKINFEEIFSKVKNLMDIIRTGTPWKVISQNEAEGDDIIAIIAENSSEKTLIISADKDLIQCQKNVNVKQYSFLTKKYITPEQKDLNMENWLLDHVCLGDKADDIPSIFEDSEFSDEFSEFLKEKDIHIDIALFNKLPQEEKDLRFNDFDVFENGTKKFYKKQRIGKVKLKKILNEGLDKLLKTKVLKENFERNRQLILFEYIPKDLKKCVLRELLKPKDFNINIMKDFLSSNGLNDILIFANSMDKKQISVEDFW